MLFCAIFISLILQIQAEFLKGVNYGNRFVPEDWMTEDGESIFGDLYGSSVSAPDGVARVSLCDVTDDRILRWLNDTIKVLLTNNQIRYLQNAKEYLAKLSSLH